MRFLALDFETGGTDSKRNFPVSLGVALVDNGQVASSKEWLIAPPVKNGRITREYDVCALEVSGISWTKIKKEGMQACDVITALNDWAIETGSRDLAVVAYNAPFDLAFYSELLFAAGGWGRFANAFSVPKSPLVGPWQCALMLARDRLKLSAYSLDNVCAHLGLSRTGEKHGSMEDAILAAKVYMALTGKATE